MPPKIFDSIQYLKGVGPSLSAKLNRLGIVTVEDLLYYFPKNYEDRRNLSNLDEAKEGEKGTFRFKVIEHSSFYYQGKNHPKIKVADKTGFAYIYCFHRGYLKNILKIDVTFYLTGTFARKKNIPVFSQFDYELEDTSRDLRITPIYRLTAGVSQKFIRRLTEYALDQFCNSVQEDIPDFIRGGYKVKSKGELVRDIHFPEDMDSLRRSKEALSYEEFFKYQVVVALSRNKNLNINKNRKPVPGKLKRDFLDILPYTLTGAQVRVLEEIESDLKEPRPMNRLLQGDVGSGKTIVALITALNTIERGGQVAFMAPTEILALQHFYNIRTYLDKMPVKTEFISGSVKGVRRKEIVLGLLKGEINIVVGTHALFSEDIDFRELSLVVIDEQHKFGVLQRGSLRAKGNHPDCIVMSATPIPRTLSMTIYGDLDVSIIDEMPQGKAHVETFIVKQSEISRVYAKVREEVAKGRQAYFIYPVIEEGNNRELKSAIDSYERLNNEFFKDLRVGLIHGKLNDETKDRVMRQYRDHEYDILVATTVVEVGVDVPNATVMVIEQAERFGLSSIHQLRGRIGRGKHPSSCFLVPDRSTGRDAFNRLMILKDTHDGFKISEYDLAMRGPGEIIGKKQSGLPSFIIDDLVINTSLIYRAQKDARRFINGEIGSKEERDRYLDNFMKSDSYRNSLFYFGG